MRSNKIQLNKFFNLFAVIITFCFTLFVIFSKGDFHLNLISLIPVYIFFISIIYISLYIFIDCKEKKFNSTYFSLQNIILWPLLIGLLIYLFKRKKYLRSNTYSLLFKIIFILNFIFAMFTSVIIFFYPTTLFGYIGEIIANKINGTLFIMFPVFILFSLISIAFFIVYKVTSSIDLFIMKIFFFNIIINIIPIIVFILGIYFWVTT